MITVDGYPDWVVQSLRKYKTDKNLVEKKNAWQSQSRSSFDETRDILEVQFSSPASLSQVSFKTLPVGFQFELYYKDRSGNRRPVLDTQLQPINGRVDNSDSDSWIETFYNVYPCVATVFWLEMWRFEDDKEAEPREVSISIKDLLLKRTVYTSSDLAQDFEQYTDPMGSLVSRTVKKWDATKAIDDDAETFWKSEPQPDPNAVVSLFLDVRDDEGKPQVIDRLWIDPLYTEQTLNIYFSKDDARGARTLSTTKIAPSKQENATWKRGDGMNIPYGGEITWSSSSLGFINNESFWTAFAFRSKLDPKKLSPQPHVLLADSDKEFQLFYLDTQSSFFLQFKDENKHTNLLKFPTIQLPQDKDIVVVFRSVLEDKEELKKGVYFDVWIDKENKVHYFTDVRLLTTQNLAPSLLMNFPGVFKQVMVKQDSATDLDVKAFLENPGLYLSPDPVLSTDLSTVTTIDNVVFGGDWTTSELLRGGLSSTFFESKIWTPSWSDFTVQRGWLIMPVPFEASYLKLEFSHLTQEPYPIYEPGIQVSYKTFPLSVTKSTTTITTHTTVTTTHTGYYTSWETVSGPSSKTSSLSSSGKVTTSVSTVGYAKQVVHSYSYTTSSSYTSSHDLPPKFDFEVGDGSDLTNLPQMYGDPVGKLLVKGE